MHQLRMGTNRLNGSTAEKNLGIILDPKLNDSKRHFLVMNKAKCTLGYNRTCKASRLRDVVTCCTKHWKVTQITVFSSEIPKSRRTLRDMKGSNRGLSRQVRLHDV